MFFRARSSRDYKIEVRRRAPATNALIRLGWPVATIAKALRVSTTTVYNDLWRQPDTPDISLFACPRHEMLRRSFKLRTELLRQIDQGNITKEDQSIYDALVYCMEPYAP